MFFCTSVSFTAKNLKQINQRNGFLTQIRTHQIKRVDYRFTIPLNVNELPAMRLSELCILAWGSIITVFYATQHITQNEQLGGNTFPPPEVTKIKPL